MSVVVLNELPECRLGHTGSVLVAVWSSELTVQALNALTEHQKILAKKHGKITLVSVVLGASKQPPPEVREHMSQQAAEVDGLRHGNIVVVQAKGLAAIITRTYLAALSLVSPEHMRVFKTLDEAAAEALSLPGQDAQTKANTQLAADLADFAAGK
jgi:hypothetical protein